MYLFEAVVPDAPTRKIFIALLTKYSFTLITSSRGVGNETSSFFIRMDGFTCFILSEFPNNCSTVILGCIQDLFNSYSDSEHKVIKTVIDFAIELCNVFKYGALIITTTSSEFMDFLITGYQFEEMTKLYNPHSARQNIFMIKKLNQIMGR